MAFRASSRWRSVLTPLEHSRGFVSATTPKSGSTAHDAKPIGWKKYVTGDYAPIAIMGGFVAIVGCMAVHSIKQQVMHHPSVSITKKRRGALGELEDPDTLVGNTDRFFNKSFLRKIGNIQEKDSSHHADPTRPDPFKTVRKPETIRTTAQKSG